MALKKKKIIFSGSSAVLASLELDTPLAVGSGGLGLNASEDSKIPVGDGTSAYILVGTNGSGDIVRTSGATGLDHSGSFSGSFEGDGSGLTGTGASSMDIEADDGTTSTISFSTDRLLMTTASAHGFGFTITGDDYQLETPQDLQTGANVTFGSVDSSGNIKVGGELQNGAGSTIASFAGVDPTFAGDVVIGGNLTVSGDTIHQDVQNVLVEDKFVLLNSGSDTGDGGIIIQTETSFTGVSMLWDDSAGRWGTQVASPLGSSATTGAPDAYVASVVDVNDGQSDISEYQKAGNIIHSGSDVFMYVEE